MPRKTNAEVCDQPDGGQAPYEVHQGTNVGTIKIILATPKFRSHRKRSCTQNRKRLTAFPAKTKKFFL